MEELITEAVQYLGEDVSQLETSLAERYLFTVVKFWEPRGKRLDTFHSVVMKLIWIS